MIHDCVILAGGSGTRLWPASSSKKPKQFLAIAGDEKTGGSKTFFSAALDRALSLIDKKHGRIIIVAGKSHTQHIIEACGALEAEQKKHIVLIPEPVAKNTGPAIAAAIAYANTVSAASIAGNSPHSVADSTVGRTMLVLTSDQVIKPLAAFKKNAITAALFAQQNKLVLFGIPPTKPETGYGYIETSKKLQPDVLSVVSFREKPSLNAAELFIATGHFYWNSGMFAFAPEFMREEFLSLSPEVFEPFTSLHAPDKSSYTREKGIKILSNWKGLDKAYKLTLGVSFDNAVVENCDHAVMVRAGFDWLDAGSWEEYIQLRGGAASSFYFAGEADKKAGCFVDSDIPVAIAGLEDLVVVIRSGKDGSPPAALITKKGETQHVRDIVEQIKKSGNTDLL